MKASIFLLCPQLLELLSTGSIHPVQSSFSGHKRNDKLFKCPCGHVENADSNAAFNIALVSNNILQLQAERDVCKSRSGEAQVATQQSFATIEPRSL